MDLSLTIIQHTFWALVLNEPWPLHQQLRVAAFAILLIFFMDISQLFWWDETWLANLVQFSSSVLLSCRHVREGRLLESKNWPNFALLLPHSGKIPLCSLDLQEVEKEGATIWRRWPLASSLVGWGRMEGETRMALAASRLRRKQQPDWSQWAAGGPCVQSVLSRCRGPDFS